MEKKMTPMDLVMKAVKQEVSAYDWQKQGTDLVKFGTSGNTHTPSSWNCDSWND